MIKDIGYNSCVQFWENQIGRRNTIRELSKEACGDLLYAHALCLGVIESIYSKYIGVPGKTDGSVSARLPLIASFMQGIDICEICISEGLYTQAAVMLKQELETVAAVDECERGERKDRKTPNVKCVKFGLNREYSLLNGISHVSDGEIFEKLHRAMPNPKVEGQQPVSILPQFHAELCTYFYAMHILLILQIIEQLNRLYLDMYEFQANEDILRSIEIAYSTLVKCGYLVDESE